MASSNKEHTPKKKCDYCKYRSHTKAECHKYAKDHPKQQTRGNSSVASSPSASNSVTHHTTVRTSKMCYAHLKVGDHDEKVLLDSGSTQSVIGSTYLERIRGPGIRLFQDSPHRITTLHSTEIVCQRAMISCQLEGREVKVNALVASSSSISLLLGNDFLSENNIIISFGTQQWWFNGQPERYDFQGPDISLIEQSGSQPESTVHWVHIEAIDNPTALPIHQKKQLDGIISSYGDVFSQTIGLTNLVQHHIDLLEGRVISVKPYRYSLVKRSIIEREVKAMLAARIIEPSNSPWSFPVVLVRKKDGGWRFCGDYRKLNAITKKDVYTLPRIDDLLDSLRERQYFTLIDLRSSFWQIEVAPEDREKTAFTTHLGTFQFVRMPFGLTNAPATSQRLMDKLQGGLKWNTLYGLLDDSLIATNTFEERVQSIAEFLQRLRTAGLTAKEEKCHFVKRELPFLGQLISPDGLKTAPGKIEAIRNYPVLQNVTEVRRFMGMINWYRNFIPNVAQTLEPIVDLTRKGVQWTSQDKQQEAFEDLKLRLTEAPVLVRPDYSKPFTIQVDASNVGLGATLTQPNADNCYQAIAFASRRLNHAERQCATIVKECLAIIWAIEHFRPYLEGTEYVVESDHRGLQWLKNLQNPTRRLIRWALRLQEFSFTIKYRPGKKTKQRMLCHFAMS